MEVRQGLKSIFFLGTGVRGKWGFFHNKVEGKTSEH